MSGRDIIPVVDPLTLAKARRILTSGAGARLRTRCGLSQAELAPGLGVARASLANWESSRSKIPHHKAAIYVETMEHLATVAGYRPWDDPDLQDALLEKVADALPRTLVDLRVPWIRRGLAVAVADAVRGSGGDA